MPLPQHDTRCQSSRTLQSLQLLRPVYSTRWCRAAFVTCCAETEWAHQWLCGFFIIARFCRFVLYQNDQHLNQFFFFQHFISKKRFTSALKTSHVKCGGNSVIKTHKREGVFTVLFLHLQAGTQPSTVRRAALGNEPACKYKNKTGKTSS